MDVGGDLRGVGDRGAKAVGEGGGAFDRGGDADFVADGGAEVEDSRDGDAGARDAGGEEFFGVGKGFEGLDSGDGGGELEVGGEAFGLALQGQGFQGEEGYGDVAGEGEGAGGEAVDAVDGDALFDVRVGEDVGDFARGSNIKAEGDGFAEIEVARQGAPYARTNAGDAVANVAKQVTFGCGALVGNDLAKIHLVRACYFVP